MAKLTTATRSAIPGQDFALPGRRYPIEDASHARNALSRVSANGTPAEQSMVRSKVKSKFTGIGKKKAPKKKAMPPQMAAFGGKY